MEYIPGYTTLKDTIGQAPKKLYEYFTSKLPNKYELFATQSNDTQPTATVATGDSSGWFSGNIGGIDETTIPRWSSQLAYKEGDYVKHQGFIYLSRKNSSNVNPIESITDDFIKVNSDYWISQGLSSNVRTFDPENDASTIYRKDTIVNFNNILYSCTNPGAGCVADYTSNVWRKLSSDYIAPLIPASNLSYSEQLGRSWGTFVNDMVIDFTIEEVPGETLYDTVWRVVGIVYSKVYFIILIILGLVLASFSANDLLHKKPPFRVLAFVYTFMFIFYNTTIGWIIFFYYLFRSIFGSWYNMNALKIYAILPIKEDPQYNNFSMFPSLYTYPPWLRQHIEEGREISNIAKLASHGDIIGMIARSLRVPLSSPGLSIHKDALAQTVTKPSAPNAVGETAPTAPPATPPTANAATAGAPGASAGNTKGAPGASAGKTAGAPGANSGKTAGNTTGAPGANQQRGTSV
jgi:hypothetical protein